MSPTFATRAITEGIVINLHMDWDFVAAPFANMDDGGAAHWPHAGAGRMRHGGAPGRGTDALAGPVFCC